MKTTRLIGVCAVNASGFQELLLPVDSLGPTQLAAEALDDGFIALALDLRHTDVILEELPLRLKRHLYHTSISFFI